MCVCKLVYRLVTCYMAVLSIKSIVFFLFYLECPGAVRRRLRHNISKEQKEFKGNFVLSQVIELKHTII